MESISTTQGGQEDAVAVAVAAPRARSPRSPPLAFQMTSNDALWAPVKSPLAPLPCATWPYTEDCQMQAQLDKQVEALSLQHQAFLLERESWQLERERLYRRIAALELLLKTPNGHSPARSPILSPPSGSRTALCPSRLASIAEMDSSPPGPKPILKRESAPARIDLSTLINPVSIDNPVPSDTAVYTTTTEAIPEFPASPPVTRATLSPPPPANRHLAGHTPLKAPRPGNFSPALSSVLSDRLTDTPTRSNTTLNEAMAQHDVDEDRSLKGPLHMPELPNSPGAENFTMDMLDAKLQDVMEHPEDNQPIVLQVPSPAEVHVTTMDESLSKLTSIENSSKDDRSSQVTSIDDSAKDASFSRVTSSDDLIEDTDTKDKNLDNGGIKLRKKPSSNFGAPLGQFKSWRH